MALLQQIEQAFIKAFKERNQPVVLVLRGLKAAIKNAQIAARKQELTEDEVVKVLRSESKKRKEALELYQQGGRPELAEREQHELDIISAYLPVQMDEQQVRAKQSVPRLCQLDGQQQDILPASGRRKHTGPVRFVPSIENSRLENLAAPRQSADPRGRRF